jgi:transcriptional regulator with XRE-family HTH domain
MEGVDRDPRLQFGANLRSKRLALGLSQEQLAEKADLHWTYIGGIERGERNLGLLNIVKVARALKITPSDLFANIR